MKTTRWAFLISILVLTGCKIAQSKQSPFEGRLVYKIDNPWNPNPEDSSNYQIIYANDSMLRVETFTDIGKQIYIKHIPRNRAYILMDIEYPVAIQIIPDTTTDFHYEYKTKRGTEIIGGIKSKLVDVRDTELDTTITMNYHPSISSKYSPAMNGFPGLPIRYYLYMDEVFFKYELISLEDTIVNVDLFGIPSNYQIITVDEFIEMVRGAEEE